MVRLKRVSTNFRDFRGLVFFVGLLGSKVFCAVFSLPYALTTIYLEGDRGCAMERFNYADVGSKYNADR